VTESGRQIIQRGLSVEGFEIGARYLRPGRTATETGLYQDGEVVATATRVALIWCRPIEETARVIS
jgi:hypothetical protein